MGQAGEGVGCAPGLSRLYFQVVLLRYYYRNAASAFDLAGKGGVSARFGGVGAWRVRRNSAFFM